MNKKFVSLLAVSILLGGSFATASPYTTQVVQAKKKSVSAKKSKKNLAEAVTTPMKKENYETLEKGLIQSAQQDAQDTSSKLAGNSVDSEIEQHHIKKFHVRFKNLTSISRRNDKDVTSWKKNLTSSDYKKLKSYNKLLDKYISALQDYASDIDSDGAVQNDPNASADDKKEAQDEINKSQDKFNQAKTKWEQSYDQLSNTDQQ